jgi:hypothetical protein
MITKGKIRYLSEEKKFKAKQVIKWCKKIFKEKEIEEIEFLNGKINFFVSGIKFKVLVKDESVLIGGMYRITSLSNTKLIMVEDKDYSFNEEEVKKGLRDIVYLIEKISEQTFDFVF